MNQLAKRIELVANVCIIAVALVICGTLVTRFVLKSPPTARDVPGVAPGTRITLADMNWAGNGKTLLLVLSTGCKFCSASATFYQRLVSSAQSTQKVKIVAMLPQGVEQSRKYLKSLNVSINEVKQAPPNSVGAKATPTLILVDGAGTVTNSWVGQLPPDKEAEVLAQLR